MTFAAAKFRSLLPAAIFALATDFLSSLAATVICGNLLGESALAATNLMQGVFGLVEFVGYILAVGTGVQYSKELGAFHLRRARGYYTLGVVSAIIGGLVAMLLLALARAPVLAAYSASAEVTAYASSFWLGYLPAVALAPLAIFFCTMCYADGGARWALVSCAARLVTTWVLALLLTKAFGAPGCALGIGCGYLALIAVALLHFRNPRCMLGCSRHFILPDLLRIVQVSLGDASKQIGTTALIFTLNAYVLAKFGSGSLSVTAVVIATLGLSNILDGIGNAIQPLVSVYFSERNTLLVKRVVRLAGTLAIAVGSLVTLVLLIWPQLVLAICGIHEPATAAEAIVAVRLVSIFVLSISIVYLMNSYYVYIGRECLSSVMAVGAIFVMPVILAPLLEKCFGLPGIWLGIGLSPLSALALMALYITFREGFGRLPFLLPFNHDADLRVFDLVLTPERICRIAEEIGTYLLGKGIDQVDANKASLVVEEALMTVHDRNAGRRVLAEITVDLTDGALVLILRDDGEIFNLTDADQQVSSFRVYLVSSLMVTMPRRRNQTTTGFNRNILTITRRKAPHE